jgi:archaemetzincin
MKLHLLRVGLFDEGLCRDLQIALEEIFRLPCEWLSPVLDAGFALHGERQQYHSSRILEQVQSHFSGNSWRLIGVTGLDLYIPVLTFVFGEAQMNGPCAVVSGYRLRQEFYGLPPDPSILLDRLVKECVHEVGHTLGLTHCEDYRCAMASNHSVEGIDLKERVFCPACLERAISLQQ